MCLRNSKGCQNRCETLWTTAKLGVAMGSKAESDHQAEWQNRPSIFRESVLKVSNRHGF
jgi:hypothetical protein